MHLNPPILCLSEARETLPQQDNIFPLPHHEKAAQTDKHTQAHVCTRSIKHTEHNPQDLGGGGANNTSEIVQILV